jgi:putative DNA methylase
MILRMVLDYDISAIDSVISEFEAHAKFVMEKIRTVLEQYYHSEPKNETIGYFWARTVQCESPACGAEIPLLKSFWLQSGRVTKSALRYQIIRKPKKVPVFEFEIFEPKREAEVPDASVSRARARCLCCGTVLAPDRVRAPAVRISRRY